MYPNRIHINIFEVVKILTVTFFGHRDAPQGIQLLLETVIIELIEKQDANLFYVGDKGCFDKTAYR